MNYSSQLTGWAIDRAIEVHKHGINQVDSLEQLYGVADSLKEKAYIIEEDIGSTAKSLLELLSKAPDDEDTAGLVAMLIAALEDVQRKLTHAPKEKVNV